MVQRYSRDNGGSAGVPPIVHEVLRSPGQPLDESTRAFFEPRFGHDFSRVRIHADSRAAESANAVQALAYTVGRNLVFGASQYAPGTAAGNSLLAHELTHVVQQHHAPEVPSRKLMIGPAHDVYEEEADHVADRVALQGLMKSDEHEVGRQSIENQRVVPRTVNKSGSVRTTSTSETRLAREIDPDDDDHPVYSKDGLMVSLQSGTCQNGGGASVCDPATGNYNIVSNSNTCCTKDCTQQHEQTHVADFNASGCCKALSAAYNAKGADKNAVVKKYNDWLAVADPVSECRAYNVGVTCADGLAKAKDCDGKGKGTDCCKDIAEYKSHYGGLAKSTCASAAAKMPPCPAF